MLSPDPSLDIWLADLGHCAPALRAVANTHDIDTPAQAARLSGTAQPSKRLAGLALRVLLAGHVGLDRARAPLVLGATGKPALLASPGVRSIDFNLAHCDGHALIAISTNGPVGVDIENVRPVRINPQRRAMLECAAAALEPHSPLPADGTCDRFLQAWVRLEALAKATGEGISALLARLGVRGRQRLPMAPASDAADGAQVWVRDLHLAPSLPHLAAVAGAIPALAPGRPLPAIRPLPPDLASLEQLMAGRSPTI